MSASSRVIALLVIVELGLAALWWWLADGLRSGQLRAASGNAAETATSLSSIIGAIMGVVAGLMLFTALLVRRKTS